MLNFTRYKEFLARVEQLFDEIRGRHPGSFQCRMECHSCCKPGITIGPLEAARIKDELAKDPVRAKALLENEKSDPYRGKRCAFLSASGACGIYELRPLVCRSHGAPLQFKDPEGRGKDDQVTRLRDVCTLNFQGQDLSQLPPTDLMNLDTLNTLLALLTKLEMGENSDRQELKPSSLLKN